jgi:penicillin-binding protein-related factor A (putative recombinase)
VTLPRVVKNHEDGKTFEKILKNQGMRCGLLVLKNNLSAKYIQGGRVLLEKSNLDFMIANQRGVVGFFDAKSFDGDSFKFSEISPHQLERAKLYNDYEIPAGFVVFFRELKKVFFYSGKAMITKGPNNSFSPEDGVLLGNLWQFNLSLILLNGGV